MRAAKRRLPPLLAALALAPPCLPFAPSSRCVPRESFAGGFAGRRRRHVLGAVDHDDGASPSRFDALERVGRAATSAALAFALSFSPVIGPLPSVPPAHAADGAAIGLCLLKKCRLPLAKCVLNPNCLANVICINTCNGKPDEVGCQIECGDIFENNVVGEFNKCAVSDMTCVPQKPDDGSYPIPPKEKLVQRFDTSLFNGRWYITAGQNKLFDTFPCQVHFFTETSPGRFFGKLNWRIEEPDGEFFTRDAVQEFVQDPKNPAHMINHDNDYLHYQDDWYIVDYAPDGNREGVPPFAFVYYRGENDAWVGYGGAVVYTREASLPEALFPRLREAARKVGFDFDNDFEVTDNTCRALNRGEEVVLRQKFAGKMAIQTERQLQQQAVLARTAATNEVGVAEKAAEKALQRIEGKALQFEQEIVKELIEADKEIVKDLIKVEGEIVKDVVKVEQEIAKDVAGLRGK